MSRKDIPTTDLLGVHRATLQSVMDFCNSERGRGIIETANFYQRPPIEALVPHFLRLLGEETLRSVRVKQLLGRIVRDVALELGWETDRLVTVRGKGPIGQATLYKRKV